MLSMLLAIAMADAAPAATTAVHPPVDYAVAANWVCRPGRLDACSAEIEAATISAGDEAVATPSVAPAAAVDCFYVYPTASSQTTTYSDLAPDAGVMRVVRDQAARLRTRCRVFAPFYHQLTVTGLRNVMAHTPMAQPPAFDTELQYRDVLDAWRAYLANDNHGRGVVLIGHSQGATILKRLIAEQLDGKPGQRLLVAAYLAGNADLGRNAFHAIPPCKSPDQTGCVIAWSSYPQSYDGPRTFGTASDDGPPLCVNPAALVGGWGTLKAFLPNVAGVQPPFVKVEGALSAICVSDRFGSVLRIRVEPGSDRIAATLRPSQAGPSWGLHPLDIGLVQGNVLDLITRQAAAWIRRSKEND